MATSQGIINKTYVSALSDFLDTREINKNVTDVQNNDFFADILWFNGNKKVIETGQSYYNTFVNEDLVKQVDTTGGVSGSGGPQLTIILTAATSGYIQKQDLVILPTGARTGIVYSVASSSGVDTIVVRTVDGGNLTCTAGDLLAIYSNAYGEASGAALNIRYGLSRRFNKWQIFRITSSITDVQKAATIEVEFEGQPYYAFKDHIDKKIKLKIDVNAAIIGGTMSTTTFTDANPYLVDQNTQSGGGGGPVQTTGGINKYIEAYGTTLNPGTTMSFGAIDDVQDNLIAKRAAVTDFWLIGSKKARRKYDVFLKALASSGVNSVRITVPSSGGSMLDFETDTWSYGGFMQNFVVMPMLDDPKLFAQTVISKSVYWIPKDTMAKIYGGGEEPAIRIRYVPHGSPFGSYDALIGETHDGALNPVNPRGTVLYSLTDFFTKQGVEWLNPEWGVRQQVLS